MSMKGREPSFSSSMVNLTVGRTSLRWWSNYKGSTLHLSALCCMCHTQLQKPRSQGSWQANSLKNSMYKLATTAETGEPLVETSKRCTLNTKSSIKNLLFLYSYCNWKGCHFKFEVQSNLDYPDPTGQLKTSSCLDKQKDWITEIQ